MVNYRNSKETIVANVEVSEGRIGRDEVRKEPGTRLYPALEATADWM